MVMDLTIKMLIYGVPKEGAVLEYPISLFSQRCKKSVLKLRHWNDVSRTEFQARGHVQPGWGTPWCLSLPFCEGSGFVASFKKNPNQYSLRDLTSRKANFCICFPSVQTLQLLCGWKTEGSAAGALFPYGN